VLWSQCPIKNVFSDCLGSSVVTCSSIWYRRKLEGKQAHHPMHLSHVHGSAALADELEISATLRASWDTTLHLYLAFYLYVYLYRFVVYLYVYLFQLHVGALFIKGKASPQLADRCHGSNVVVVTYVPYRCLVALATSTNTTLSTYIADCTQVGFLSIELL